MSDLFQHAVLAERDRDYLAARRAAGEAAFLQSLPGAAQAFLALALWKELGRPVVWVLESARALDAFQQDVLALWPAGRERLCGFPALEASALRGGRSPADLAGDRLVTLQRLLAGATDAVAGPAVIATSIQALFQKTLTREEVSRASPLLAVGQEIEPGTLVELLEREGYEIIPEVQAAGQAAPRGGLLDVWPPTESMPLRLEWFGNTLESIRVFDPLDQRSMEKRTEVRLAPAGERIQTVSDATVAVAEVTDYLPDTALWVWSEPESLRHHAALYWSTHGGVAAAEDPALACDRLRARIRQRFGPAEISIGFAADAADGGHALDLAPCAGLPDPGGLRLNPDALETARMTWIRELAVRAGARETVCLFLDTEGARARFREACAGAGVECGRLQLFDRPLSGGFASAALRLTVVSAADLYGFRKILPTRRELHRHKRAEAAPAGARIGDWTDLQPGDWVVHLDHGIGKYLGLYEIEFNGRPQEVLTIEYAAGARLHVPVTQAHLLTRYSASGRRGPAPHELGGARWTREKAAAQRAVQDLAGQLLQTQSERQVLPGHACAPDNAWQRELEAAFPYRETPDQLRAVEEVKRDMESSRPMDRLVCGDVGYGKTEVAMRAAFKAVMDDRQVAMLVPTTILAQQHFDTFRQRMAAFPVRIEMLSRFVGREEQQAVVRRVAAGRTDIVIGTHRLLQRDVAFKELGLVIIDEEQRFGVRDKERLKQYRRLVDVLTLTATPIPRTLYMGLSGARDLSVIQTPPQERLPIETIVAPYREDTIRRAILHELDRGGQVFHLYNRVQTIDVAADHLRRIVPSARVEVAHGQMPERRLAEVMRRFAHGEFDVLLCTTIIESGMDMPNVNTILIDRADRFGLAELYQLRGRVGRYKNQAYAYLLLPRHGQLFDVARRRIGAIRQYSSLGAGFKLALRDLEIRGAGNLLGAAQSGHIAAVGFDLYCQLLRRSVAQLKGAALPQLVDVPVELDFLDASLRGADAAAIPPAYLDDENLRLKAYRRLAEASSEADLRRIEEEWRDRFGPLPPPARRLLHVARVRVAAAARGVASIEVREDKVLLRRKGELYQPHGRFPRLKPGDVDARLTELLRLVKGLPAA